MPLLLPESLQPLGELVLDGVELLQAAADLDGAADGEHDVCGVEEEEDQGQGEQQVVVKPLPPYLNRFNIKSSGIAGCTILGDGNISIILDVANFYTAAQSSVF